jgi:hypothetical protein
LYALSKENSKIPGTYGWGNQYYPALPDFLGLTLYHCGNLQGFYQLPIRPIAHQCSIRPHQLRAYEAALHVPRSVCRDDAMSLQISILIQQADPVFFPWTYDPYGKCVTKGCWHATGVTFGELFCPLH